MAGRMLSYPTSQFHHHNNYGEPVVMAYPCDDGFFISVMEPPPQKPVQNCCSHERRVKPNYFRYYPTATDLPDAVTEIGSGSACQNVCYRSFRIVMFIWTGILCLFMAMILFLGLYYWSEFKIGDKESREEIIKSNQFFDFILEYGPIVTFFVSFCLLLIPCLGFFGAYKENTWLLITYVITMFGNTAVKMMYPVKNHFMGFAVSLLIMLIPFTIHILMNKRMSRAI